MPTQRYSAKSRLCCLKQRALVYDLAFNSYTIESNDKVRENYEDYWAFEFGPRTRSDSWDLFLNEKTDRAIVIGQERPPRDAVYVAGLHLNRLGVWGKFLRRFGALNMGYILRPAPSQHQVY
ncbi:hypothetical protein F5Y08DRAFT_268114 [Xylaria arbuscula]|nr:hypothetical protein F5Y08DRAFT_268114 [Xylaria arbuscula]